MKLELFLERDEQLNLGLKYKGKVEEVIANLKKLKLLGPSNVTYPEMAYVMDRMKLPKIGAGSSRSVFKIDENYAVKLAMTHTGKSQNGAEYNIWGRSNHNELLCPVYEAHEGFLWIIVKNAVPMKEEREFEKYFGESIERD